MKYIDKNKKEPNALKEDKKIIKKFLLSGEARKEIVSSLLKEQGYICAYCMQRIGSEFVGKINKPRVEIEHYLPQQSYPDKVLDYENMLGVCNGGVIDKNYHCDKTIDGKALGTVTLKKLNPLDKNCEELITYQKNGTIISRFQDEEVESDLNEVLNLNNDKLCEYRKNALDKIYEDFKTKNKDKKTWTKKMFEDEIEELKTIYEEKNDENLDKKNKNKKNKFKEYVNFLIWFFEQKKNNIKP